MSSNQSQMYQLIRANVLFAILGLIFGLTMAADVSPDEMESIYRMASITNSRSPAELLAAPLIGGEKLVNSPSPSVAMEAPVTDININIRPPQRLICRLESATVAAKPATSSFRQLSAPLNMPSDFLSMLQKGLIEGKNSIEAHVDEHFGVSLPTKLIEKTTKNSKTLGSFDEGRKLEGSRRSKALQNKVDGLQARMSSFEVVFEIIQGLIELVLSSRGGSGGGAGAVVGNLLESDTLQDILGTVKSLQSK